MKFPLNPLRGVPGRWTSMRVSIQTFLACLLVMSGTPTFGESPDDPSDQAPGRGTAAPAPSGTGVGTAAHTPTGNTGAGATGTGSAGTGTVGTGTVGTSTASTGTAGTGSAVTGTGGTGTAGAGTAGAVLPVGTGDGSGSKSTENSGVAPSRSVLTSSLFPFQPRPQWLTPFQLELLQKVVPVVLVDARDTVDFYSGHLPGAVHIPWRALTARGCGLRCGVLDPDLNWLREVLTDRGLRLPENARIVVYGAGLEGSGEEARAFWTLEYLGVEHVAVLIGGYPRWKAEGRPVERMGSSVLPKGRALTLRTRPELGVSRATLNTWLGSSEMVLVDARDPEEFQGERVYGLSRGGHIPGAVNLPWQQVLGPDGALKSEPELRKLLVMLGITPDKHIVTYCTGGVRSAMVYLALRSLGYARVTNYAGSMWDWTEDANNPVE